MTSTKTATLLRRYIQEKKFVRKPPKIFLHTCCLGLWFPAGNDGNNDLHLWHDGQVHFTHRTRWFPLSACGEILPGIPSQPLNACLILCVCPLYYPLPVWHFPENGSEQRRSGDYWWIHRNLPKGTLIIIIINIISLPIFCAHMTHLSCICSMIWTGWKYYGFHAALWECHLVSAQSCGAAALCFQLRVSGPEVTSIVLKKKQKWAMQHIRHILIQAGAHFLFAIKLFFVEQCTEFVKLLEELINFAHEMRKCEQ